MDPRFGSLETASKRAGGPASGSSQSVWSLSAIVSLIPTAFVLIGCAPAVGSINSQDSEGRALPGTVESGTECSPLAIPGGLPEAAELVAIESLATDLAELTAGDITLPARVVFTMWYQADGLNVRRDVLEHDVGPIAADSIQKLVFAHRREASRRETDWGVRLGIDISESGAARFETEPQQYCPPRPRDARLEAARAGVVAAGTRYRSGRRERVILMRAWVHPNGYVVRSELAAGPPLDSRARQVLSDHIRRFSFLPATVDGIPVEGSITIPVRVQL